MTHPTNSAEAMREACAKVARTAADDPLFDHEEGFVRRIGSWIALRIEALPVSNPTDPASAMREACKTLWQDLLERDDRTSPAEYPDMALITFDEFIDCLDAVRVALPYLPLPTAQLGKRRSEVEIRAEIARLQAELVDAVLEKDALRYDAGFSTNRRREDDEQAVVYRRRRARDFRRNQAS